MGSWPPSTRSAPDSPPDPSLVGFAAPELPDEEVARLEALAVQARGDILTMTTLADSGHPGGSMSSLEMYLVVMSYARVSPKTWDDPSRDRVIISHGHTSPGAYASLAAVGFIDRSDLVAHFRQAGSIFEGHVERHVPGVEWSTGNLGQGLSAACGMALASKLTGAGFHTFCLMSDAEQAKGQVAEARRFVIKYGLGDLTVLVDYNDMQISGRVCDVMPQDIRASWEAAKWHVIEVDGHDLRALYGALHEAVHVAGSPTAIICHTHIGRPIPFMQDTPDYHGKALTRDEYAEAMGILGLEPRLEEPQKRRRAFDILRPLPEPPRWAAAVEAGEPRNYEADAKIDNRSAWGRALSDIGQANIGEDGRPKGEASPIAVFDCDLTDSVRTEDFALAHPHNFFQMGVQEHTTAATAGALSIQGVLTFWADFGVFGIDETYNQHRLSDVNATNLKVVLTHCGIDVGEDGRTHHCVDYVGVLRNAFGWRVVVPADPNQTDRVTRWMAGQPGNVAMCLGRSKAPVVTDGEGRPAFGGDWRFEFGKATVLREGDDCALIAMGGMTWRACRVHELLAKEGVGCCVVDMPTPTELDEEVMAAAAGTGLVVTYEDHNIGTGLGMSVGVWMAESGRAQGARLVRLGVRHYESSGAAEDLFVRHGLDPVSVAKGIVGMLRA